MGYDDDGLDLTNAELYASDTRGIYIPQHWAESVKRELVHGVEPEDYDILIAGPDHELYWDVWAGVLSEATIDHPTLGRCFLWQDGDLWVVPFENKDQDND